MITAKLRYLRMSPRKARLAANFIKGMNVMEARTQLKFLPKRAAGPILRLLDSAVANAFHNFSLPKENLYISRITVEPGPSLKRWLPRAMGRATPILKRTSHITIILDEKIKGAVKEKPVKKPKRKEISESANKEFQKEQPKIKRPEKVIAQKKGLREITRRMFQRKSI